MEADADVEEADADTVAVDGVGDEVSDLIDGVVAADVNVFGLFAKGLCNSPLEPSFLRSCVNSRHNCERATSN